MVAKYQGSDMPAEPNANAAKKHAEHPKHNALDWANFAILSFTFLAAFIAAIEAKRLADATDVLVSAGQKTSVQQAEDTRSALALTKQAADAATKSATASQATAEANQTLATETHRLVENSEKSNAAAQRMVDTATKANAVATDLVRATQKANETTKSIQRAFIFAKGAELRKFAMAGPERVLTNTQYNIWQGIIEWENSGNTPSKNLTIDSTCLVVFKPVVDPERVREGDENLIQTYSIADQKLLIGPKESSSAGFCMYAPNTLLGSKLFDQQLYVFGTAKYADILSPDVQHRTEFCFHMIVETTEFDILSDLKKKVMPPPVVLPTSIKAIPCNSHNCADDECSVQK